MNDENNNNILEYIQTYRNILQILIKAILSKNSTLVEYILSNNINPNVTIDIHYMRIPIFYAIDKNDKNTLQILIKYGTNVNYMDNSGRTVLMYTLERKRYELLDILLTAGADPFVTNHNGGSAFDYTCDIFIKQMLWSCNVSRKLL